MSRCPTIATTGLTPDTRPRLEAVATALAARDKDAVLAAMSDAWLDDCTLSGSADRVRDGVEAWFDAGVTAPILVPSSTSGGQVKAFAELFDTFS